MEYTVIQPHVKQKQTVYPVPHSAHSGDRAESSWPVNSTVVISILQTGFTVLGLGNCQRGSTVISDRGYKILQEFDQRHDYRRLRYHETGHPANQIGFGLLDLQV